VAEIDAVLAGLRALRRKIAAAIALDGASRCFTALFAAVATSLFLDRVFELETAARAAILLASLAGLGWVVRRHLVARLAAPPSDDSLAVAVEARFPELGDRLITAVQLAREGDPARRGMSPQLAEDAIRAVHEPLRRVALSAIIARRRLAQRLLVGGGALALLAIGAAADPETARIWFRRNVLLRGERWPRETRLLVDPALFPGGVARIVRGSDIAVVARSVGKVHPEKVRIRFRDSEGHEDDALMKTELETRTFRHEFREVAFPLRFRLEGGDDVTDEYRVELVAPPEAVDVELSVSFPEYAERPPRPHDLAAGDPEVLAGGALSIRGRSTKPLAEARLVLGEREETALPCTLLAGDRFEASVAPEKTTLLGIRLRDTDGLSNPSLAPRFLVRVVPDRAPRVRLKLRGVGAMVVPAATVPFEVRIRDDVKAVAALLEAVKSAEEGAAEPMRMPFDPSRLGADAVDLDGALELLSLQLAPGAFLTLYAAATDNARPEPHEGRSEPVSLRIVTLEELLSDLLRRQQEQRQVFEELIAKEKRLRDAFLDLRERPSAAPGEVRDFAESQSREQRQIGRRIGLLERDLAQVLDEMQNNHVSDPARIFQLREGVVGALAKLRKGEIETQGALLDEVARLAERAPLQGTPGEEAARGYDATIRAMEAVLANMVRVEGFTEIVESFRALLKRQDEARRAAYLRWLEEMRKIFPDFQPPKDETAPDR
jgi:hypothetical protein